MKICTQVKLKILLSAMGQEVGHILYRSSLWGYPGASEVIIDVDSNPVMTQNSEG